MNSAQAWLAATYNEALAGGRQRVLDTVLGPIRIIDDLDTRPRLNWPSQSIRSQPYGPVVAALVITRSPVPDQVTRLLQLPHAMACHRHGRGAFPVRWVPGRPWIAHYQNGPFIARDGDRVVMAVSTTAEATTWADRVLREILIHGGRRRGFGLCHCAVVTGDSGGVLITGPSGAGKTNLALKLGRYTGVQVVTVDRGIVGVHRGRLAVGTLPFGLNIHRATLTDLGCFDSTLVKRYPPSNDKHYLDVAAAQRYCGITLTAWADVAAVVRLLPSGDTAQWQLLDESETARALTEACSADTDPGFQTEWLGLSGDAPASPRWLTPSLPGWLLCHRPDQPLPNAWIDEVTDVLRCNDRTTSDHYRGQRGRS